MLVDSCAGAGNDRNLGETTISKWKDDKKAVYLLSFDDEAPSQLENVIPELNRRRITATFYVVTGNPLWARTGQRWAEAAKSPYVVLANHTFTHQGVTSVDQLESELASSNSVLYGIYANRPQPFLLSFGQPGGVPWNVSADEQAAALKRHNLLERPPFKGSPMNYKTQDALIASVDEAIAEGDLGYNDMHGVGGDWLTTPVPWFTALLDKLESEETQLWIPDVASYDKYVAERDSARVDVLSVSETEIRVSVASDADPALYDSPLTLKTHVPFQWSDVRITQGTVTTDVRVVDGIATYNAVPGSDEIAIAPMHHVN